MLTVAIVETSSIVKSVSPSPMTSTENQQNGGNGKASPPPVSDDVQQPQSQPQQQLQSQQHQTQLQPPQRTTRYINNSSLSSSVNKSNTRTNSTNSITPKGKALVRSHAVSEETSPPPPDSLTQSNAAPTLVNNNVSNKSGRLRQQNSEQSSSIESSVSIDNSTANDKQGQEDKELLDFIVDTLNRSTKDRTFILRIESELTNFVKDTKRLVYNFSPMSAYQRMLVHRISGYFHLEHNVDPSSSYVVVTKTRTTKLPEVKFRDRIEESQGPESNKTVLKRESADAKKAPEEQNQLNYSNKTRGSKTYNERAEEYSRARRRIFNGEQQDPSVYYWSSSSESNNIAEVPQGRQGKYMNKKTSHPNSSQLLKVESFETATISRKNRPQIVNKSYSFGGYGATDGSSNVVVGTCNNLGGFNRFNKQDSSSSSSGLSPASSGYKSQSFQSSTENTMTSPNSSTSPQNLQLPDCNTVLNIETLPPSAAPAVTPHGAAMHHCILATPVPGPQNGPQTQYILYPAQPGALMNATPGLMQGAPLQMQSQAPVQQHQPPQPQNPSLQDNVVFWAVTDLNSVPNGSVLIDPRSGLPLKNPDGSTYFYDPTNPPKTGIHPVPPSAAGPPEVMIYQQPQQIPVPVEVINSSGDVEHMTQWFTQMGVQQPQPGQAQAGGTQQWSEQYYIPPSQQNSNSQMPAYISSGGTQIILDPSKMGGTVGLSQQYYPVQPNHNSATPPQQHHYVMATPSGATQQAAQPVMMQYSVPTSASATSPYMVYGVPYGSVAQAATTASYNTLFPYGQQQSQPSPRAIHPNSVHQSSGQPLGMRKDVCYVPTSASSVPSANSASYLYNPYYGNVLTAAHVQNSVGGPRFPGNPGPYASQFFPRPQAGYFRSYTKKPRKNSPRNASNSSDKPSNPITHTGTPQPNQIQGQPQQQQQQQSADKKS